MPRFFAFTGGVELDRETFIALIAPLSQARRRKLLAWYEVVATAEGRPLLMSDLRIIVRDQRNHIRNLEEELLPYLKGPQAEQGAFI